MIFVKAYISTSTLYVPCLPIRIHLSLIISEVRKTFNVRHPFLQEYRDSTNTVRESIGEFHYYLYDDNNQDPSTTAAHITDLINILVIKKIIT